MFKAEDGKDGMSTVFCMKRVSKHSVLIKVKSLKKKCYTVLEKKSLETKLTSKLRKRVYL